MFSTLIAKKVLSIIMQCIQININWINKITNLPISMLTVQAVCQFWKQGPNSSHYTTYNLKIYQVKWIDCYIS